MVESWRQNNAGDYTSAINQAIANFGYDTFDLNYYHDCGTWNDYRRWLAESGSSYDGFGLHESAAISDNS